MLSRKDYNDFIARLVQDYVSNPAEFLKNVTPFRVSIEMIESLAQASRAVDNSMAAIAAAEIPTPKRRGRPPMKRGPGRPKKIKG